MPFEPIELQREIYKTEPADTKHPHTIRLSDTPSEDWTKVFSTYNFALSNSDAPKVIGDGIAIPNLPYGRPALLFTLIDEAIKGANAAEAERVNNLPPSAQEIYEKWFDDPSGRA